MCLTGLVSITESRQRPNTRTLSRWMVVLEENPVASKNRRPPQHPLEAQYSGLGPTRTSIASARVSISFRAYLGDVNTTRMWRVAIDTFAQSGVGQCERLPGVTRA